MKVKTKNPCRCTCSRKPLLAYYGLDEDGDPYVHTKIYKQDRLYGEWFMQGGVAKIKCRECFRWTRIVFNDKRNIHATHDVAPPPMIDGSLAG
mgnify:CR=1 FL=1